MQKQRSSRAVKAHYFSCCPHQQKRELPEDHADFLQNTHMESGVEKGLRGNLTDKKQWKTLFYSLGQSFMLIVIQRKTRCLH